MEELKLKLKVWYDQKVIKEFKVLEVVVEIV